jgi:hypothetical protein
MKTPKLESSDSEIAEDTSEKNREREDASRRFSDTINSKSRKLKLDRRVQSERRIDAIPQYKGPSRRQTIDQRSILIDRRDTH